MGIGHGQWPMGIGYIVVGHIATNFGRTAQGRDTGRYIYLIKVAPECVGIT